MAENVRTEQRTRHSRMLLSSVADAGAFRRIGTPMFLRAGRTDSANPPLPIRACAPRTRSRSTFPWFVLAGPADATVTLATPASGIAIGAAAPRPRGGVRIRSLSAPFIALRMAKETAGPELTIGGVAASSRTMRHTASAEAGCVERPTRSCVCRQAGRDLGFRYVGTYRGSR